MSRLVQVFVKVLLWQGKKFNFSTFKDELFIVEIFNGFLAENDGLWLDNFIGCASGKI